MLDFRNENTVYLGSFLFFGHGVNKAETSGIMDEKAMIKALNSTNPQKDCRLDATPGYVDISQLPTTIGGKVILPRD